ncbi:polyribonucleotide nucleotidyltransferase [Petrotoga sp. 9PWA.NaAc.5.4]|uniref:polyribonucleotide nucleotidyltransferase n=1 Tax=Petrotoga sp. 9PWA.NaAc.5.4 TaxID=1434328 RepID=UPI000CAA9BB2|nr:polyribonucleotide nucleotidyltransferase [Petrotoga sp. 9PWA.NaAc.5.4]PNR95363.1 polyribonucleotide nucleotidyltransferase [Petrotoga sp. 9PWA.NaAc.5.4]
MKIWEKEIFGRKLRIEHGKVAKQSLGSIMLTFNDSTILVTSDASEEPIKGTDFFPLTVEFQEKFYAVGKIPGGFIKREGKPSDEAILAARLIDRPIRPLFPENFYNEVQIIVTVFSMLNDDSIETWGITGASLALNLSPIPFNGLVAGVRIGYVDGQFIVFPNQQELKKSKMDMVVAGTKDAITMVEGESLEVTEEEMVEALMFAHEKIKEIISFEEEIISEINVEKWEVKQLEVPNEFINDYLSLLNEEELKNVLLTTGKKNRDKALSQYKDKIKKEFEEKFLEKWSEAFYLEKSYFLSKAFEDKVQELMRKMIIDENRRVDGRTIDDIRDISCEVGLIPRVHGSALFTRGETQSLAVVTLGAPMDVQLVDTIFSDEEKRFMLHYNFPPFSTGEVKRLRGVSRREIGHGHLAERAHKNLIPSDEEFPYTIRVVSEILESNGSSSMASVCSASLALMDAGIPIKKHVAGIAMGLVFEEDNFVVLTDILGMEDHLGDMDFKVAGTRDGITAFQMDVKTSKVNKEVLQTALEKAKIARNKILDKMYETMQEPKKELSPYVPIIKVTNIPISKIGEVIGPGGRTIKEISEIYGVEIFIEKDGKIKVTGNDKNKVNEAIKHIQDMTAEVEKGKIFEGTVKRIEKYGIFVEVLPGKVGMLHVSNLQDKLDAFKIGDKVKVEVLSLEDQGKFQLKQLKEE